MKNTIKKLICYVINKRNPSFYFDEGLPMWSLFLFIWEKGWYFIRGLRVLLYLRMPNMLLLGQYVKFSHIRNIKWEKWVKLEDHVYLSAPGDTIIMLGTNVGIGAFSRIIVTTQFHDLSGHIRIGNNVGGIGEFSCLGGAGGLEIGRDTIIGQYFSCHPENHRYADLNLLIRNQGVSRKGIKIGKNCWIGAKVTVLDGVTIGDNCIIAAGAVVTRDMAPYSIIAGIPARVIKSIR